MKQFYLLETIDPVILSSNNSSTNNHQCLDYIPGSAMLGLIASRLYSQVTPEQSWDLFHNGQSRFGPCYPVTDHCVSLPMPASWHATKTQPAIESGRLNTAILTNHTVPDFERDQGTQYKQCRSGFINQSGVVADVQQGSVTKTAIDRETGKAKDQQLFSYSYIEKGQAFIGWFDADKQACRELISAVLAGQHRLGRSRNSEFGRVQLTLLSAACLPEQQPEINQNRVVLWCLSDVEIIDQNGLPTTVPSAGDIHPQLQGQLNAEQSFIRINRVSRFNQARKGYDSEQILIEKGSVLVYDSIEGAMTQGILDDIAHRGVGINKQQGLGWVLVNPSWADSADFSKFKGADAGGAEQQALFESTAIDTSDSETVIIATPDSSSLIAWIADQQDKVKSLKITKESAYKLLNEISSAYRDARAYNNIRLLHEAGPSSTQWQRIAEVVKNNTGDWFSAVFEGDNAICKSKNDEYGWGIQFVTDSGKTVTFADHLGTTIKGEELAVLRLMLEKLCRYDLSVYKDHEKFTREVLSENGAPAKRLAGGQL